jgi:hypothetical protein
MILTSSSRVSGFLVSVPDIFLLPLRSLCVILYIRVSEEVSLFRLTFERFVGACSKVAFQGATALPLWRHAF